MILTGPEIVRLVRQTQRDRERGDPPTLPRLDITPFDPARAGPNSYDVTVGAEVVVQVDEFLADPEAETRYGHHDLRWRVIRPTEPGWTTRVRRADTSHGPGTWRPAAVLDPAVRGPTWTLPVPPTGLLLVPGRLYLAAVNERVEAHGLVPILDGRSSYGRLAVTSHCTAGRGDSGFRGQFTCEILVLSSQPVVLYPNARLAQLTFELTFGDHQPYAGKYQNQEGPVASRVDQDPDARPVAE